MAHLRDDRLFEFRRRYALNEATRCNPAEGVARLTAFFGELAHERRVTLSLHAPCALEGDDMPTTNVVNLDALIRRADLAAPGEGGEDITSLPVMGLEKGGLLYPALRKPDFQRETANWSPEQVADLISTFARRELIPAVILWRAGQNVFVIDGAHRLSALIAWVQDDYGDGEVSRRFFQNAIADEQTLAARKVRELVKTQIGSYQDHKIAAEFPQNSPPELAARAARIPWWPIQVQWIQNADHDKAEKAFIRINQGGTKIDATEQRIINARRSATALATRAILRGGTGHDYWDKFDPDTQARIEGLGKEVFDLLFSPSLTLPIKTLDVPVAGQGYGPHVLPFVFDVVNLTNKVGIADSSRKRGATDDLQEDQDGGETIKFLTRVRAALWRVCSTHASSPPHRNVRPVAAPCIGTGCIVGIKSRGGMAAPLT
jgi:hypothetical protein